MRERYALAEAGTAQALALYQAAEDIFAGNFRVGSYEQFAENFEAVFLAARVRVAQHTVRLDDVFEQH